MRRLLKAYQLERELRFYRFAARRIVILRRPHHFVYLFFCGVSRPCELILALHGFSKKAREFIEISLIPVIKRMVVALGAGHPHAEKNLADGSCHRHWVGIVIQQKANGRILGSPSVC